MTHYSVLNACSRSLSCLLALSLTACGGDDGPADASLADTGAPDAPLEDGGTDVQLIDVTTDPALTDGGTEGGADAGAGGWRTDDPLPLRLQEISAAVIGDLIYVAGGFEDPGGVTANVRVLDTATGTWSDVPALPFARHHLGLAAVGEDLYAIGGMSGGGFSNLTDAVHVLYRAASAWRPLRSLPEERAAMAVGVFGNRIVIAGGQARGGDLDVATLIYDTAADTWTEGAAIPTGREHVASFAHEGELWVLGGRRISLSTNTNVVEVYNPETDTWRDGPRMALTRGGFGAAVLDGFAYVVGGEQPDRALSEAARLDLAALVWADIDPVSTPRHGHAMASAGGRVYVIGGADRPIFAAVDVVESFAP